MNSPVTRKSSVRGPHHDTPGELYGALLYFRDAADKSTGGDLQGAAKALRHLPSNSGASCLPVRYMRG